MVEVTYAGNQRVIFSDPVLDITLNNNARGEGTIEGVPNPRVTRVVDKVLDELSPNDSDLIRRFYLSGNTEKAIGEALGFTTREIRKFLRIAVANFKVGIRKYSIELGYKIPTDCVLCNAENYIEVNELLHLWIDTKGVKYKGVLKHLRDRCDVNCTNVNVVHKHIKEHMGLNIVKEVLPPKKDVLPSKRLSMEVSLHLYEMAERYASVESRAVSDIMRDAIETGLRMRAFQKDFINEFKNLTLNMAKNGSL